MAVLCLPVMAVALEDQNDLLENQAYENYYDTPSNEVSSDEVKASEESIIASSLDPSMTDKKGEKKRKKKEEKSYARKLLDLEISKEPVKEESKDYTLLCDSLNKIILVDSKYSSSTDSSKDESVQIVGLEVPASLYKLQKILEEDFIKKPFTKYDLKVLKQTILDYYRSYGRPLVLVKVPTQSMRLGTIKLEIVESTIDEIVVRK